MKYYDVIFPDVDSIHGSSRTPKGLIFYEDIGDEEALKIVKEYIRQAYKGCFKDPEGELKYKYLVPGGLYNTLWDWDSFFMACSVDDEDIEYSSGSIKSLLKMVRADGKPAKNVDTSGDTCDFCTPVPVQIQYAYIVSKRLNDFSILRENWDTFEKMISWYEENCIVNGYFVYPDAYGNGLDNNPSLYGRGDYSVSACDFISFIYREYRALQKISKILGKGKEDHYGQKADALKKLFTEKYFDQMDNCFYCIDINYNFEKITLQGINWVTYLKFRSFSNIFPLWGGLATEEQAKAMRDMIMSQEHFLSVAGVRSHAKSDPVYNNEAMANPSNWQGPVWGLSTFLTALGLARYGYKDEAFEVAMRLIKTFAIDIKQNGTIHEYYHGDSGQPIMRPDFMSWNIMALRIIDDIKNGTDSTTYDLLD